MRSGLLTVTDGAGGGWYWLRLPQAASTASAAMPTRSAAVARFAGNSVRIGVPRMRRGGLLGQRQLRTAVGEVTPPGALVHLFACGRGQELLSFAQLPPPAQCPIYAHERERYRAACAREPVLDLQFQLQRRQNC